MELDSDFGGDFGLGFTERGMRGSRGGGCSKVAVSDAIALDRAAAFGESAVPDFGYGFLTSGGGVDRFLAFAFSNVEARALKAGDLPLTRTRSGLNDTLLERCGFSVATDLPPCDDTGARLFGLVFKVGRPPFFIIDSFLWNEFPCIEDLVESHVKKRVKNCGSLPSVMI